MTTIDHDRGVSLESTTIVDADSHLRSGPEELLPYMDRRSAGRRIIQKASHFNSEVMTKTRVTPKFPNDGSYEGGRAGYSASNVKGKIGFMDEFGVDKTILTTNSGIATINHDQTAVDWARAYNLWLADNFLGVDERLYASMAIAHQMPDRAAEEIDRMAHEDDIVAVQMPTSGQVPPAGHWRYDPIYEAAQDHSLPILLHSADSTAAVTFPVQHRWSETFTEAHAFTFPAEVMWHLVSMVCNGVPEKFPDLEFVFQEPGFEWVPWMMWRLDDHYLQNSEDLPVLSKHPSEYIRDQFYFTTQPLGHTTNVQHMGWMIEMAGGGETLMFATDHPHADFDTPEEFLPAAKAQLDADEVREIMGETAVSVFDL